MILLVGHDQLLLRTRADVLRSVGIETASSSPVAGVPDGIWDVLVLCHSLAGEECRRLVQNIRARSPATAVLLLLPQETWRSEDSLENGVDATCIAEPKLLIAAVSALLASRFANHR